MATREWYSIQNKADNAEIFIYDVIGEDFWGDGVNAKSFATDVKNLKVDAIDIHINSPGGSVFDGVAIYNLLKQHKAKVNVTIDGMALSIASVIAMAGDTITMAENAMMMIHDPWTMTMGSAEDFRKEADTLDKVKSSLITSYGRTGMDSEKIADLMSEETWMTAADAVEMGFADSTSEKVSFSNSFDLSRFKHTPKALVEMPEPEEEVHNGYSAEYAKRVLRLRK